jgi:hypothetical protein
MLRVLSPFSLLGKPKKHYLKEHEAEGAGIAGNFLGYALSIVG